MTNNDQIQPGFRLRKLDPSSAPIWREWLLIPKAPIRQVCLLSLNLNPHRIYENAWPVDAGDDYYDEFYLRLRVTEANSQNDPQRFCGYRYHRDQVLLSEFAAWALSIGWDIPSELAAMAQKPEAQSVAPVPQQSNDYEAATQPVDSEPTNPRTCKPIGGEPHMKAGRNSADSVSKWVKYQAHELVKKTDKGIDLAERICLLAEKNKYESARGKLSIPRIVKLLPPGITGGRAKNTGRPKNN